MPLCDNASPSSEQQHANHACDLPRIPVAMRHPCIVTSVKQFRSSDQSTQLRRHIVSESFIPVVPSAAVQRTRKRRRPPVSCATLIIQAISTSESGQMTLQGIYKWIIDKYPSLYNAEDTGWQNTIRHNLSLNKCFRKIPKKHGKGGYWSLDTKHLPESMIRREKKRIPTPSSEPSPQPSFRASPAAMLPMATAAKDTQQHRAMQIRSILN